MEYRERVKELCKERGITLKDLAGKLNITDIGLGKSLRGSPNISTFERIADALGVPLASLFDTHADNDTVSCPYCGGKIKVGKE